MGCFHALNHKRNSEMPLFPQPGGAYVCGWVLTALASACLRGVVWLIHSNWCEQCPLNHSLTLRGHVLSGSLMLQIASVM